MNDTLYLELRKQFERCGKNIPSKVFCKDRKVGPAKMNAIFALEKDALVPFDLMPDIERLWKCQIELEGDYVYESQMDAVRFPALLRFRVHNNTCKRVTIKNNQLTNYGGTQKPVIIHTKNSVTQTSYGYDGKTHISCASAKFFNYKTYCYVWVKYRPDLDTKEYLKNEYQILIHCGKQLREHGISFDSVYSVLGTGKMMLHKATSIYRDPTPIGTLEGDWIQNSTLGALQHHKKGIYDNCSKFDVNSSYPSILSGSGFIIPYGDPEWAKLNEKDIKKYISFGIYRVKITKKVHSFAIKYNLNGYYTHIDLQVFRNAGVCFKLDQDCSFNAMLYSGTSRMPSRKLFKKVYDKLYSLKNKGIGGKYTKQIMNAGVAGGLVESAKKHGYSYTLDTSGNSMVIPENAINVRYEMNDNNEFYRVTYDLDDQKRFKTDYARLKPFLYAEGRHRLRETMIKAVNDLNNIVWVHTDGFIVVGEVDESKLEIGESMGEYTKEYSGKKLEILKQNIVRTKGLKEI